MNIEMPTAGRLKDFKKETGHGRVDCCGLSRCLSLEVCWAVEGRSGGCWVTCSAGRSSESFTTAAARREPVFTMSRGGTLKVKSFFKLKSSDKDSREHRPSDHIKDAAGVTFRGETSNSPQSPGPVSPGGSVGLAADSGPVSPRTKKGLRLLFRSSTKKSRSRDSEEGAEVFSPDGDGMDAFGRPR